SLIDILPQTSRCFYHGSTTDEMYTLSLHDALPISAGNSSPIFLLVFTAFRRTNDIVINSFSRIESRALTSSCIQTRSIPRTWRPDRKSTRLNSSHVKISYAVLCLKKKKIFISTQPT